MCGIFAASLSKPDGYDFTHIIQKLNHRGPDDTGHFWSSERDCYLAHKRLTIIDLTTNGRQPLFDQSGNFSLVFNGEIYNYNELKIDLERSHGSINWQSETDSEVIIEGFAREGVKFLENLNGMYSLVIYDDINSLFYVVRDPIGIKPLFYASNSDGIFFSSEIKPLLEVSGIEKTLRLESFADQLAYMYVPEPFTLFENIQKLPPGNLRVYQSSNLIEQRQITYKNINKLGSFASELEAIKGIQDEFSNAVARQLRADVPVSVMLSGGLDSSAVVCTASKHGANFGDSYTISMSDQDGKFDGQSDDLLYAKMIADQYDLDLDVTEVKKSLLNELPKLMPFMGDGFCDPAAINTFLICDKARSKGIKVLLSGQGADEYLGGYRRYIAEQALDKIPSIFLKFLSFIGSLIPETFPGRFNASYRRIKRLMSLAGKSPRDRIRAMYTWTSPSDIQRILGEDFDKTSSSEFNKLFDNSRLGSQSTVEAMMKVDRHYDLLSLNLCYTDRMSMAAGVEVRVPFLDLEFLQTVNRIPSSMKIKSRIGKYIFKKAMENNLSKEIIYREKAGFSLPLRSWMRESSDMIEYYLNEERLKRQGIFSSVIVNEFLFKNLNGEADHSYTLFVLLCQQIWLDEFVPGFTLKDEYEVPNL